MVMSLFVVRVLYVVFKSPAKPRKEESRSAGSQSTYFAEAFSA
jgi:hypothetical protein